MISILLVLVIIGVMLYLVQSLPLDPAIHTIIRVVVVLCVVLWLLRVFGVVDLPVPHLR